MNRKTLFRKSKPLLRPFISHENSELGPDMGILWAAYKRGSFQFPEMDERQFTEFILQQLSKYASVWMMEDENKGFRSGRGPVCVIPIHTNGWKILPEVYWFSWATLRNKLRCSVAFVQKTRYDKTVGCCEIRTIEPKLPQHLIKYISTFRFVGKVWFGTPKGDQYIYSIKGAKHAGADGNRETSDGVQRASDGESTTGGGEERESLVSRESVQSLQERHGNQ
jgi:hypothetical protein